MGVTKNRYLLRLNKQLLKRASLVLVAAIMIAPSFDAFAQTADPSTPPGFLKSIGKTDTAPLDGAMANPHGIAHDSAGNVYVADRNNDRIQKFSANGAFITKWGTAGSGNGQFDSPEGVAIDSDNNVYVTDYNNGRVQKFTSTGAYITQWGENDDSVEMDSLGVSVNSAEVLFKRPSGIATDSSNNVYVSDANDHIQKFTADGTFVSEWGATGSGDGEFYAPEGIAIDSNGDVFVADKDNYRIQKFSSSGTFLSKWGVYGQGDGEFAGASAIAIDANDDVYVVDTGNYRVQKFSIDGTYILEWGEYGGNVDAASVRSHRSVSANDVGNGTFGEPRGITIGTQGEVYVVDAQDSRVQKFDSDGAYESQWGEYGSENKAGEGNGEFNLPADAATDSNGNLYVVDKDNHRVQKFSSDGTYITQWGGRGSGNGQLRYPNGIAVDSQDNVYVSDSDNYRIQKFSSTGAYVTQWGSEGTGNGEFGYPIGITTDGGNNVYVVDTDNHRIQKFSSTGTYISQWGQFGQGDGELNYPLGIAADKNNNIYVADANNDRIQKFSSSGTFLAKWGEPGGTLTDSAVNAPYSASNSDDGKFENPNDVTVDAEGNMYVMDTGNARVQKFSGSGAFLTKWGSYGGEMVPFKSASLDGSESRFNDPWGITSDKDGNVYVVDTGNHRVQKFGYVNDTVLAQPGNAKKIVFQTPSGVSVDEVNVITAQSISKKDGNNTYPMGLVDFTLSVQAGSTQQISLLFETELKPNQVVARKYHSAKDIFTDVPGASVTETTVDGKHALQLTYDITDGGNLDDDATVNGVIIDPVGLAAADGVIVPGAPDSGAGTDINLGALVTVIIIAAAAGTLKLRSISTRR